VTKIRDFMPDAEDMRLDWEAKQQRVDVTRAHCKRKREKFRRDRRARRQMRSAGQKPARYQGDGP